MASGSITFSSTNIKNESGVVVGSVGTTVSLGEMSRKAPPSSEQNRPSPVANKRNTKLVDRSLDAALS